jgi:hypothetical protein
MMREMRTYSNEALKTIEPLPMPKMTPPTKIYDALNNIGLEDSDLLRVY